MTPSDPYRDYLYADDGTTDIHWRRGRPDYGKVNALYESGKSQKHPPNSLEAIVERLVKSWEMEIQHKVDPTQWQTVSDVETFRVEGNGACPFTAQQISERGSYHCLLESCSMYDVSKETFDSSHAKFTGAFTKGFAFEVIKVLTGPPTVTFTWRHWAPFTGEFNGHRGHGETIELRGLSVAEIDDNMKIKSAVNYFDTSRFFDSLCPRRGH